MAVSHQRLRQTVTQRRAGVPKKRHMWCKWEKPSHSWLMRKGASGTARSRGSVTAAIHGVFLPFSLFSSHLCFASVSTGFLFKQIFS